MTDLPDNQAQAKTNIIDLFRDAVKQDGTIDMRSSYGRAIKALKDELDHDQFQAAAELFKRDIAIYTIIEKAIECHLLSNPEAIISESGINPMITGELVNIQSAKRRAINALLDLEKKKRGRSKAKKDRDLDAISFE